MTTPRPSLSVAEEDGATAAPPSSPPRSTPNGADDAGSPEGSNEDEDGGGGASSSESYEEGKAEAEAEAVARTTPFASSPAERKRKEELARERKREADAAAADGDAGAIREGSGDSPASATRSEPPETALPEDDEGGEAPTTAVEKFERRLRISLEKDRNKSDAVRSTFSGMSARCEEEDDRVAARRVTISDRAIARESASTGGAREGGGDDVADAGAGENAPSERAGDGPPAAALVSELSASLAAAAGVSASLSAAVAAAAEQFGSVAAAERRYDPNLGSSSESESSSWGETKTDEDDDEEGSDDDDAARVVASLTTATRDEWTKRRHASNVTFESVGAIQIDEEAPQVNRRYYLGLDRPSVVARRARARESRAARRRRGSAARGSRRGSAVGRRRSAAGRRGGEGGDAEEARGRGTAGGGDGEDRGRPSRRISSIAGRMLNVPASLSATYVSELSADDGGRESRGTRDSAMGLAQTARTWFSQGEHDAIGETAIDATLVEDDEGGAGAGEVVFAEPVSPLERGWKKFAFSTCLLLAVLAVALPVLLTAQRSRSGDVYVMVTPTYVPSTAPSSSPSFDRRPTLEIVRTRGHVRCGLSESAIESGEGFYVDLCRSVAAVLLGNPDGFVGVPVIAADRFPLLDDRAIDLSLSGDTHTMEREIKERTTGVGFTFSSPFYYDGMAYFGNQTFVTCAEEQKRYLECSSLLICVSEASTGLDFVQSSFPPEFSVVGSSTKGIIEMLFKDECNVIATDRSLLLNIDAPSNDTREFIVGNKLFTKEPLAFVTRNTDHEFSDTINWVVQALFYGEERGLTKNPSLCLNYTNFTSHRVSDLDFMNAVRCVGNYGEIFDGDRTNRGMNRINGGTTGMLYATPFGQLKNGNEYLPSSIADGTLLGDIRKEGSLNCGVVVPDDFDGNIDESNGLVGMSADYCRTLTAALFNGDHKVVNLTSFWEDDEGRFAALDNGTIDVLAGGRVEKMRDFRSPPSFGGFRFSTPYYYGNEPVDADVSFYSLATREDDVLFSSFVNIVVLSTIYAQEEGTKREMGEETWGIRDAIAYGESYGRLYTKNFADIPKKDRGRNVLNDEGSPQIHSFPGLAELGVNPFV